MMSDTKKLKIVTDDGEPIPSDIVEPRDPPVGGQEFQTYSLKDNLMKAHFAENWQAFFGRSDRARQLIANPRRSQRQNGKIMEAQKFRKYQGVFLDVRLHAIRMAKEKHGLNWWFQSHHRIWLHHTIMRNYYLEDRPTTEREIIQGATTSAKTMRGILQTAVEIGSLDPDVLENDKRQKVYYPTRGMVSDTDYFFHADEDHATGVLTQMRKTLNEQFGFDQYRLSDYETDVETFYELMAQMMAQAQAEAEETAKN